MKISISSVLAVTATTAVIAGSAIGLSAATAQPALAQNIITMNVDTLGLTAGPPPPPPCRDGSIQCETRTPPFFVPEGIEYYQGAFYIGNVFGGEITRIAQDGSMELVVPRGSVPEHLSGTFGTDIDAERDLLHIAAAKFPPDASLPLGQSSLLTIDLKTGNLVRTIDLTTTFGTSAKPRRSNDVCHLNNAAGRSVVFVTDSSNGQIWRVDANNRVTALVRDARFDASPDDAGNRNQIGLNGIVCHEDNYLLTVRFGSGDFTNIFKLGLDGSVGEVEITNEVEDAELAFGDGLYLGPDGELYMVQTFPGGSPAKVVRLVSHDGWQTATLDALVELPAPSRPFPPVGTNRNGCAQATTAVIVGHDLMVNCAFTATIVRVPLNSFN